MSIALELQQEDQPVKRKQPRRSTSHLKAVPPTLELREQIKAEAARWVHAMDRSRPFSKSELEGQARQLLSEMKLEEQYLGFAMVLLGNFFWKEQLEAIPFERRMLLLPHCLKHAEGCPADYDELGLDCETCGACSIADYKTRAEQLGYKVLVAEGSPVVLKLIVSGYIDGIVGVACLNVLEKAIDKVLLAGVPSYAVPLHSGDCKNTSLDEAWVWDVLDKYKPLETPKTSSYIPLMRAANDIFENDFDALVPRARKVSTEPFLPLTETESISLDFLANGGKRFRPFVTLAAYHALTKEEGSEPEPKPIELPQSVRRAAIAIEAFHKASLVHDDIEDGDMFRYGKATLHRRYDTSTALNVGDYLIGMGYRLLAADRKEIGADVSIDIVDRLADAHVKLCEGQGAELRWRQAEDKRLKPLDAMKIYALKTAPAFEAALYAGLRLAGPTEAYEQAIVGFSRQLGVGFQILNDLKDWTGDDNNKLLAGQDALSLRPTLLLALALESASPGQKEQLEAMLAAGGPGERGVGSLRAIFESCQVFAKAEKLVAKSRERAEAIADEIEPDSLRQLLYFLVDTVLAPEEPTPREVMLAAPGSLPIVRIG